VTLAWWDDAWLNEAFATKILSEWKPEWNTRLSELGGKFGAMSRDSLVSARKIRQPIESTNDIASAFDNITYEKGSAVIRMFESWVGEKQFQAGINSYLRRYAFRTATGNDFLDAISGSGRPQLASAFSSFLEQSGAPEVSNYDALLQRAPSGGGFDGGARLTSVGRGFCDAASRREFASFFEERAKQSIGGPRN
jgi:alanyl aminopeptidase